MSSQMLKATTSSTGTGKKTWAILKEMSISYRKWNNFHWSIVPFNFDCFWFIFLFTVQKLALCLTNVAVFVYSFYVTSVSDLAPGQMGIDDMKMLEQKAQQLAAEAEQDKPKPKEKILFVRFVGLENLLKFSR